MKSYFQIVLIILLALLCSHCKKQSDKVTIFGRVTDHSTGLPVAGTKVEILYAKGFEISLFGESVNQEMVTVTDKNGNYIYPYHTASDNFWPQINFSNPNYLPAKIKGGIDLQTENKSFMIDMKLRPQAQLFFEIEDVAPFDSLKRFEVFHAYNYTYIGDVDIENWQELKKPGGKTTAKTVTAGGQYVKIKCVMDQMDGKIVFITDSVFCPAFQTTTYRIER